MRLFLYCTQSETKASFTGLPIKYFGTGYTMRFHRRRITRKSHTAYIPHSVRILGYEGGDAIERLIGREGIDCRSERDVCMALIGWGNVQWSTSSSQWSHMERDIKVDKYPLGMMIRCDRVCHLVGMLLCEHYTLSHGQTHGGIVSSLQRRVRGYPGSCCRKLSQGLFLSFFLICWDLTSNPDKWDNFVLIL